MAHKVTFSCSTHLVVMTPESVRFFPRITWERPALP